MKWPIVSRKLHDEKEWSSTINCNEYNSDRLNVNMHMNQVRNFNIIKNGLLYNQREVIICHFH